MRIEYSDPEEKVSGHLGSKGGLLSLSPREALDPV